MTGFFTISDVNELDIIDGQQRLTTLSILYVALYQFAKANDLQEEADRLYNRFIINQYVDDESHKLKLKQTDTNSSAYKTILSGRPDNLTEYSNVIENYNYFKGAINESNFQTIIDGLKRLIFVEISLERDKDDPQRIFESLNSTGMELSQSDLIRNYILMDLPPDEQKHLFKTIWSPFEENAKDKIKNKYSSEANSSQIPNRFKVRRKYWNQLLPLLNQHTELFSYVSPSNDNWINAGAGISGVAYTLIITKTSAKIEFTLSTSSKEQNKRYFKILLKYKEQIEQSFGYPLVWEEFPEYKLSKVRFVMPDLNVFDESKWDEINDFFIKYIPLFENAFKVYVGSLN